VQDKCDSSGNKDYRRSEEEGQLSRCVHIRQYVPQVPAGSIQTSPVSPTKDASVTLSENV